MTSSFGKRLLLFIIAIPLLFSAIWFFPQGNMLVLNIIIMAFAFGGTVEAVRMARIKGIAINRRVLPILCTAIPAAVYLETVNIFQNNLWLTLMTIGALGLLAAEGFSKTEDTISGAFTRSGVKILILFYTGFLTTFLTRLTTLAFAREGFLIFLGMVFANDTFAYLSGVLFGKNTPKPFPVSPNKSLAGFAGGALGTLGLGLLSFYILPEFFGSSLAAALITAGGIFIAGTMGDLVESSFKRSVGIKDSGKLMLGRGGVLDSLDSILFCAPVFYFIISIAQ